MIIERSAAFLAAEKFVRTYTIFPTIVGIICENNTFYIKVYQKIDFPLEWMPKQIDGVPVKYELLSENSNINDIAQFEQVKCNNRAEKKFIDITDETYIEHKKKQKKTNGKRGRPRKVK